MHFVAWVYYCKFALAVVADDRGLLFSESFHLRLIISLRSHHRIDLCFHRGLLYSSHLKLGKCLLRERLLLKITFGLSNSSLRVCYTRKAHLLLLIKWICSSLNTKSHF